MTEYSRTLKWLIETVKEPNSLDVLAGLLVQGMDEGIICAEDFAELAAAGKERRRELARNAGTDGGAC